MCVEVFRKYLQQEEKDKCEYLDQIMRIYLRSFNQPEKQSRRNLSSIFENTDAISGKDSHVFGRGTWLGNESKTATKRIFEEYIERLQPSFQRFKQTHSFMALWKKVKEFEKISERVYK